MNLNELAELIVAQEGKQKSVSIAQVKEQLRITLRVLRDMDVVELGQLLGRVKRVGGVSGATDILNKTI
jgi:hypothetical protein